MVAKGTTKVAKGTGDGRTTSTKAFRTTSFSEIKLPGKVAMLLLAFQFGFSPIFAKYVHARNGGVMGGGVGQYDPLEGLLIMETIKIFLAFALLLANKGGWSGVRESFKGWSFMDSISSVGLSTILFSLQDYLADLAQRPQHACEPTLFLILNQTKILWGALMLRVVVGLMRSSVQWIALLLLPLASVLYTVDLSKVSDSAFDSLTWSSGVTFAIVVAMLSGLNQTLIERAVRFSTKKRDMLVFSLQLCVYKVILVGVSLCLREREHEWFDGVTGLTMALFTFNGLGGVCVALVNAYAGGDWKGYVLIVGLIMSGTWSCAVGVSEPSWNKLASVAVASASLYMYNTYPYKEQETEDKKTK